jgi:hypothetical protein
VILIFLLLIGAVIFAMKLKRRNNKENPVCDEILHFNNEAANENDSFDATTQNEEGSDYEAHYETIPECLAEVRIYDVSNPVLSHYEHIVVPSHAEDQSTFPFRGIHERTQSHWLVPDVDFTITMADLGSQINERADTDQIPSDIASGDNLYERAQTYERVPDVDLSQILASGQNLYERAQTYEHVPDVDLSQILAPRDNFNERAQTYERVPDVDFNQLLSEIADGSQCQPL